MKKIKQEKEKISEPLLMFGLPILFTGAIFYFNISLSLTALIMGTILCALGLLAKRGGW